jgi:hypothetical protein
MTRPPHTSGSDEDESDWTDGPGTVLDPSGRIERLEPAPTAGGPSWKTPEQTAAEPELELARDLRRPVAPEHEWELPQEAAPMGTGRSLQGPLYLVVVLILLGAAVLLLGHKLGTAPAPFLLIDSEPAGATVRIGGEVVGTTPWSTHNTWPEGPVKVELSLEGHRTWRGTFQGGMEQVLRPTLSARRPAR